MELSKVVFSQRILLTGKHKGHYIYILYNYSNIQYSVPCVYWYDDITFPNPEKKAVEDHNKNHDLIHTCNKITMPTLSMSMDKAIDYVKELKDQKISY